MSKIAIKKLTKSDLTLFVWHFKEMNAGNQKSINLNANVFIDKLYPELPSLSAQRGKTSFLVDLSIYGPGAAPRHSLARKIVKGAAYKNWRLNGEFVENPLETPERYNRLREGDYAILVFNGEPIVDELKLVLVSAHVDEDKELHGRILAVMGNESMRALSAAELETIVDHIDVIETHAARIMDIESAFEDASLGGFDGVQMLQKWSSKRHISKDDLRRAHEKSDAVGAQGEEFVDYHLGLQLQAGLIEGYRWASAENAIEAFDFVIAESRYLDVKSTSGSFRQKIHVSINELLHMKELPSYQIYRVYAMSGNTAKLRVSSNMQDFAVAVLEKIDPVIGGVKIDSISVDPDVLSFGDEISIELFSLE